jgi:hypothetical protein
MMESTRVVFFGSAGSSDPPFNAEAVVVDLPEVRLALNREVAEVVFAVRVIILREIAEGLHSNRAPSDV